MSVDHNGRLITRRRRSHNGCMSGAVAVLTELMGEASLPCAAKIEAPTVGGWTVGRRRVEYWYLRFDEKAVVSDTRLGRLTASLEIRPGGRTRRPARRPMLTSQRS
jgi:hypothetical protein